MSHDTLTPQGAEQQDDAANKQTELTNTLKSMAAENNKPRKPNLVEKTPSPN